MDRRWFLSGAAMLALGMALAGCGGGGGHDDNTGRFNNPAGTSDAIGNLSVQPERYQSGFIPQGTQFVMRWPSLAAAPRSFGASLIRYQEARGGEERAEFIEANSASQPNPAVAEYTLRRRDDNGNMAQAGVYYLEVETPAEARTFAYVVVPPAKSATLPTDSRDVDITNPGGTGSLSNLVLHWTNENQGSANIPVNTEFVLQFPNDAAAPSNFKVRLGRFKEGRGSEGTSYDNQKEEVFHDGNGIWRVRRRDNFPLEQGGTYILEVSGGAITQPIRYAFIVRRF